MNRLEAEKVLNNLELDIEKARHMAEKIIEEYGFDCTCLLYTSPSPRDTR